MNETTGKGIKEKNNKNKTNTATTTKKNPSSTHTSTPPRKKITLQGQVLFSMVICLITMIIKPDPNIRLDIFEFSFFASFNM